MSTCSLIPNQGHLYKNFLSIQLYDANQLHPDQQVYGATVQLTAGNSYIHIKHARPPLPGIIACDNTELGHESKLAHARNLGRSEPNVTHFVPLGKNGKPAWSKAVRLEARVIRPTESECKTAYNQILNDVIRHHEHCINYLTAMKASM